jgi:hypothetical protein
MRVTTLNQIFGMLTATARPPACGHYPYPPSY